MSPSSSWIQVTRQHEPAGAWWSRCMTPTSHSSTRGSPPMISPPRERAAASPASLARMDPSSRQALVTMQ